MVIFPITKSGRMQKSNKKKKKKNFLWDVFPCGFSISDDKKGGKSKWFFFISVRVEGKSEINYKKKEKKFFLLLGGFLTIFWSLVCRKR